MSNYTRSARGDFVDFELLGIKAQLAAKPAPKAVVERLVAIEERDGSKAPSPATSELLAMATEAAATSAKAAPRGK